MEIVFLLTGILIILTLLLGFLYWSTIKFKKSYKEKEEEIRRRMYELSILKEVGDRIEYSLNLENITDIIIGSLPEFIDYNIAGYMLISPDKVRFKAKLKNTVSKEFVGDVKKRMKDSLSALLEKEISDDDIEEIITGGLISEDKKESVNSFFNIPLVVSGNVMGVFTIAHSVIGLYKEEEMTLLYKIVAQALNSVTRLENVVKREQGKLGAMVEGMSDGMLMVDRDYRVLVANPMARNIAGVGDKQEVTIFDFMDGLAGKFALRGKIEESIAVGKALSEEDVVIGGSVFQVLVSPVSSSNDIFGVVVVFHDITRVKQAEKIREDFTSMLVHELRAPLDSIRKIGELMKSDESIREDIKVFMEYIDMIYQSSSEMLGLVNSLLDVSRIESGKFDIYRKPSSIEEIVSERIRFFEPLANDSNVTIRTLFSGGIPKIVDIDNSKISQVLNNLLSNAIKFTRAGGSISVSVFAHKDGNSVNTEAKDFGAAWFDGDDENVKDGNSLIVAVTDTGDGISEENMAKLFNKFVQFESSARSGRHGTGLGLVIARGIVEAHGGVLRVNSKKGQGSTFYFTINL